MNSELLTQYSDYFLGCGGNGVPGIQYICYSERDSEPVVLLSS